MLGPGETITRWSIVVPTRSALSISRRERTTDMKTLAKLALRLRHDDRGVTALEYGLIAAVMGALIVTAFNTLGGDMGTAFTQIGTLLTSTAAGM
jgi:pilus assembly protein Flp/PilA